MRTRNVTIWIVAVVVLVLCGTAQANLVAHWEFEEGQGDTTYDSAGSNNGTIHGAQWTAGKVGDYALEFDGNNDYVETNNGILNLTMENHTIALWAKNDDLGSGVIIAAGDSLKWWCLSYSSSHSMYLAHWDDDVIYTIVNSDGPASVGQWTHIAMRRDGSEYSMFIDGVKQIDTEAVGNDFQIEENIYFGQQETTGQFFDGSIDDARIYNRALSEAEIMALVPEPATVFLLGIGGMILLRKGKTQVVS
jgi:hypothetical protein